MATDMPTGGCQCGALRYRLRSTPTGASLCHCRMCQKATGNLFLASTGVPVADLEWTRGAPAVFMSSSVAERGFCAACGTPLTFRDVEEDRVSVGLGTLDDPHAAAAEKQIGIEARVAWWGRVAGLPERTTGEDTPELAARVVSHQHPDHDTGPEWRAA